MVNGFFIIRTASYLIASFFPLAAFICVLFFLKDILLATGAGILVAAFAMVLGRVITGGPFIGMLEGSGIITLSLNSSGIAKTYLTKTDSKNLSLDTGKKVFTSVYDRLIGFYLRKPGKATLVQDDKEKTITITMPKDDFSKNYFQLMDKPMLIWNEKTQSFLSKQTVCELENQIMSDYLSLVTVAKIDALGQPLVQLTKTVSEQFKPNSFLRLLDNPWVKIILIVIIIGVVVFAIIQFGPQIMQTIQGTTEQVAGVSGKPITPIG